jgi:Potential Queuosine, Q, salvage protein family
MTPSALEEGIPITDPSFYSSELLCPDSLLVHIFRPAAQSSNETIPLLTERIGIMREVGFILCAVSQVICLLISPTDIYL